MLVDEIKKFVEGIPATLKEKRGVYSVGFTVAERKVFLSKKKLTYSAKFRVDEEKKELRFTEMLKESGFGMSSGDSGFGFKKESYKTGTGSREGSIEEQYKLFGAQYSYTFDFSKVRTFVEKEAVKAGLRVQVPDNPSRPVDTACGPYSVAAGERVCHWILPGMAKWAHISRKRALSVMGASRIRETQTLFQAAPSCLPCRHRQGGIMGCIPGIRQTLTIPVVDGIMTDVT